MLQAGGEADPGGEDGEAGEAEGGEAHQAHHRARQGSLQYLPAASLVEREGGKAWRTIRVKYVREKGNKS